METKYYVYYKNTPGEIAIIGGYMNLVMGSFMCVSGGKKC